MKFIKILVITTLIFITTASVVFAQDNNLTSTNKKAVKYYNLATNEFKTNNTNNALKYLNKSLEHDTLFVEAWLLKGEILDETNRKQEAITAFEKAIECNEDFFPPVWSILGKLYFDVGNYKQSIDAYTNFLRYPGLKKNQRVTVEKLLKHSIIANDLYNKNNDIIIKPVNNKINTNNDEFVNFVDADNKKIIFTRKEKADNPNQHGVIYKESLYYSIKRDSTWLIPQTIDVKWKQERNVGGLNFTIDGKEMYFTGCGWEKGYGSCDLYKSEFKNGGWQQPVNLGTNVNSLGWESQPFISADGRKLFFSSKRKGGKGGSDIWMSLKMKNGEWSPPVNLGDSINTPGNEMAPYLYADGNTLIFSSDGWISLGKKDLFISRKNIAGVWSKAKNIGYPVNTKNNEINLVYSLDGNSAWISSDRNGKDFDIFSLNVYPLIKPEKIYFVNGTVVDKENNKPLKASVTLTNVITGEIIDSLVSDAADGKFLMVILPGKTYAFNIITNGYLPYSENFALQDTIAENWKFNKIFRLQKIVKGASFILKNIYFEFDKDELNYKSYAELDKLIYFLKVNKDIKLLISGHTDNSGTEQYNNKLSENRAKAVYNYLVKNGISTSRLTYKGYGSSKPLYTNDTEQHKAQNRRVEFIIK
jgi:outer membrane protein OmpA-like peptidoglycan-associated protein